MYYRHPARAGHPLRRGKILILAAFLFPVLLGMTGLAVDAGQLMAGQRQAQNAADAAAMAAAMDLLHGQTQSYALSTANTFVQTYNGLSNAPNLVAGTTFNIPPSQGNYTSSSNFVEVIVSNPVPTYFMPVLHFGQSQTVQARAVAGFVPVTAGEGVLALDSSPPGGVPGITTAGNGSLTVNGTVYSNDTASNSITTSGAHAYISAVNIDAVGGTSGNFYQYPGNSQSLTPSTVGATPDPLAGLATPTTSNGVTAKYWSFNGSTWTTASSPQAVSISSTTTVPAGIYSSISITGGTVTFAGIYVLTDAGGSSGANTLSITGNATVQTGSGGVMFYNAGSNYNPTTGADTGSPLYGQIQLGGTPTITLSPLVNSGTPFDGLLFYYERANTQPLSIAGHTGSAGTTLSGTLYAPNSELAISGNGVYNAQFLVGYVSISGNGTVTINHNGNNWAKANEVFLVE